MMDEIKIPNVNFQGLDKLELYIKPTIDPFSIVSPELIGDTLDEMNDMGLEEVKFRRFKEGLAEKIEVFDERQATRVRGIDRNEGSGVYRHHEVSIWHDDGSEMIYSVEIGRINVQNYLESFQIKLTTAILDPTTGMYKPLGFPAMAIMKGNPNSAVPSYSKLVIYGASFARFGMEGVRKMIDRFIVADCFGCTDEQRSYVYRLDICCDVNVPKFQVDRCNRVKPRSEIEYVREIGSHETSYYGSNTVGKMLRVYDKLRDTKARGKNDLYPHLSGTGQWTRLETEFYPFKLTDPKNKANEKEYDWKMDLDAVFDKKLIRELMLGYILTKNYFFKRYVGHWNYLEAKGMMYEKKEVVKLTLDQLPNQYVSQTRGLVRKIYEMCGTEGVSFVLSQALYPEYERVIGQILVSLGSVDVQCAKGILEKCLEKLNEKRSKKVRRVIKSSQLKGK